MRLRVEIRGGEVVPRGYGVAWYDLDRDGVVCLPLGLNVLASWARAAYRRIRFPETAGAGLAAIREAERCGYEAAKRYAERAAAAAYTRGVEDGRREAAYRDLKLELQALRSELLG